MRAIDIAPFSAAFRAADASADLGAVPMLQWLPITQLRVDPRYQRDVAAKSRRMVPTIAPAFAWRKFAPVEGGLFAIIDGQHRTLAAALRGIEQVPCLVVIADLAQQANVFACVNGQALRQSISSAAKIGPSRKCERKRP